VFGEMQLPASRLYGVAIALVSGLYSIVSGLGDDSAAMRMGTSVMTVIGAVVIVHGIVLLTPLARRLGTVSGPLMAAWAAVMLTNQLLAGTMGWDAGMVALAILMLISGLIMSIRTGGS
jgi:hypothetical protein